MVSKEEKLELDIIDFRHYLILCKMTEVFNLLVKKGLITQGELDKAIKQGEEQSRNYGKKRR